MQIKITDIAQFVTGEIDGDATLIITGIAKIEEAVEGQISFISNPKYAKFIETTGASVIIVSKDFPKSEKTLLRTENPYLAFLTLIKRFMPNRDALEAGIHPTAVIDGSSELGINLAIGAHVVIGKNCHIGDQCKLYPGVVIGNQVKIGANTTLYPNVSVREDVVIGDRVIIHNGTVLGSDGFGFAREGQTYQKIPQVGSVVIEDDVEIGANCTIDRATLGETRIKRGVKLDNLIQIAHNVVIGENTVIAAQTGISGSTKIGKGVIIGGQVGFVGHIEIGDNTSIGAQSGVSKTLPPNSVVFGYPAKPIMQAKREEAALRRVPERLKKVTELEKDLENIHVKASANDQ